MEYHALTELMGYFKLEFFVSVVTLLIMLMLTAKAAIQRSGRYPVGKMCYFDVVIGLCILAGNFGSLIFQGALLDISQGNTTSWLNGMVVIAALNLCAFFAQVVLRRQKQ